MSRFCDISGTDCVPTFRVAEPKPMVCFWFYQAISNILRMGTQSVHKTSENLHILKRLSAGERCIELRWFVPCNENQPDALFILSLFRQSTSTCFGHICSPSSGDIVHIYSNGYVLCTCSILPEDGIQIYPKNVEIDWRNKSSWFSLHLCIEMHGQQNIRLLVYFFRFSGDSSHFSAQS